MSYEFIDAPAEKRSRSASWGGGGGGAGDGPPASRMRTEALPPDMMREIFKQSTCDTRERMCATNTEKLTFCDTDEHVARCRAPREIIEWFGETVKVVGKPDVDAMKALAELVNVADEHFDALFDIASELPVYPRQEFTKNLGVFGDKLPERHFMKHVVRPALKVSVTPHGSAFVERVIHTGDRPAAIEALGTFGARGSAYAKELMEALYSEGYDVREAAVVALKNMIRHVDGNLKKHILKKQAAADSAFANSNSGDDYSVKSAFDEVLDALKS